MEVRQPVLVLFSVRLGLGLELELGQPVSFFFRV